jgi:hypothetical protein
MLERGEPTPGSKHAGAGAIPNSKAHEDELQIDGTLARRRLDVGPNVHS